MKLPARSRGDVGKDQRKIELKPFDVAGQSEYASREEILLVPGVGKRMLHEFLEYRPYRSLEQFRREIGKYVVDDEELARLERYVILEHSCVAGKEGVGAPNALPGLSASSLNLRQVMENTDRRFYPETQ